MAPEKDKDKRRKAPREEFEVAWYTKELGRPLQRKMLQGRFNELASSTISAAGHGEDVAPDSHGAPPPEDRAG